MSEIAPPPPSSCRDDDEVPSLARTSDRSLSSASSQSLFDLVDNSPASTASKRPAATRSVHWGTVKQRVFSLIPGDHPDCLSGPPLSISWDYVEETTESVDRFELDRSLDRFQGEQLRLSWYERRSRLIACGFDEGDLYRAAKEARKVRRQRVRTQRAQDRFEMSPKAVARKIVHAIHPPKNLTTCY